MNCRPCLVPLVALLLALPGVTPRPSLARAGDEAVAAPGLVARVTVKGDGFVRVDRAALARLGVAGPERIAVTRRGRAVPVSTAGGAQDLVFLAADTATARSAFAVYELWLERDEVARPTTAEGALPAQDDAPAAPLHATRVYAPDVLHGALAGGREAVYDHPQAPTWFLARLLPGEQISLNLAPSGAAPGMPQTLAVHAWGTQEGPARLEARWGTTDLGPATVDTAAGGAVLRWTVPPEAVPPALAALVLADRSPPAPPPPPNDVSEGRGTLWIDALVLAGPVTAAVTAGLTVFHLPPDEPIVLEGSFLRSAAGAVVHAVRVGPDGASLGSPANSRTVVWRTGAGGLDRLLLAPASVPAGTRLFVSSTARDVTPTPVETVPDPLAAAGAARHVILATPALLEGSRALARHRTAAGLPSVAIPVEDVTARYGGGEADTTVIRAFLVDLMRRRDAPLEYVVLAGDATLDRTDMRPAPTIPAPMARTIYNGATAADRLYAEPPGAEVGGPAIGRLPLRDAATMDAFVRRLVAYETAPPVDPSRRFLRFVTSEGRFGPLIDGLIERMFRGVVAHELAPAYDIEVTFASAQSAYLWPPTELNDHVLDGFRKGCLFYTYVGHGFAQGFDGLRAGGRTYPILTIDDVPRVRCEGTPPAVFVLACTTAIFDLEGVEGVGEALLAHPAGPIAYWGATRICHPAANTLLGRALARTLSRDEGQLRLGDILARARDEVLEPREADPGLPLIRGAIALLSGGVDVGRLAREGAWMYTLLGDPATRVAFPRRDVRIAEAVAEPEALLVTVEAPLEDGTALTVTLESPRDRPAPPGPRPSDPLDPAAAALIRERHAAANDLVLSRGVATLAGGRAQVRLARPEGGALAGLVVKAWCLAAGDVHQGAVVLE